MSTQIQFLRTDQAQLRPDPNILANGMPLLNFNEQEPGLFFKARDGSLVKIGPTTVGELAPNSGANGYPGNTLGEMWLDTSGAVSELKIYDGTGWVIPGAEDTRVSSVGLSMPTSVFEVEGTPITDSGTFEVNLIPQVRNRVLAGPVEGAAQVPQFRALANEDIPGLDASKTVSGIFDQSRIPSLDASKVTSGVFNSARIPGIDATKIVSGVLPYTFGGTGQSSIPLPGQLLIGGISSGWNKTTLTPGPSIGIINSPGNITIKVSPPGSGGEVLFNNGGSLAAAANLTYDGNANTLDLVGSLSVEGRVSLEYVLDGPTKLDFITANGSAVSLQAPGGTTESLTFSLPSSIPSSGGLNNILFTDDFGQMSLSTDISIGSASLKEVLRLEDAISGNSVAIRAPSLAGNLNLTLPASFGSGGAAVFDTGGGMSVTNDLSLATLAASTSVTTPTVISVADSPGRTFITGVATLTVSSNGTYTLLDIPCDGSPVSASYTVFVHDESAASGTGTLTQTFNAHYDGTAATVSAGANKVDSWSATTEPTFSADFSTPNFRLRVTTASGSNTLNFMVNYTYVVNV